MIEEKSSTAIPKKRKRDKGKENARYARDREKIIQKRAEWRANNKDKIRAKNAAYAAKNPDSGRLKRQRYRARERAASGNLSLDIKIKLLKLQKGRCACCNADLGSDFHLDHIIPLVNGGTNNDSNIQLLTASCNMSKGAKDPIEFMQSRGFLI